MLITGQGAQTAPVTDWIAFNNTSSVRNAALGAHGIGRLPRYLVEAELASGRLREVLPGTPAPLPFFALFLAKVRTFVAFLTAEVKRLPGWTAT